jgi:hypothetical protein
MIQKILIFFTVLNVVGLLIQRIRAVFPKVVLSFKTPVVTIFRYLPCSENHRSPLLVILLNIHLSANKALMQK